MEESNSTYKAVVIGGSAGSIRAIKELLRHLADRLPVPVMVGLHRLQNDTSTQLAEVIQYTTTLTVIEPENGTAIEAGYLYLAPANRHMLADENDVISLSSSPLVQFSRPSIDVLMLSAAQQYGSNIIGILLTGANKDGALGMKAIHDAGGLTIVQDPNECYIPVMPRAALAATQIDHILRLADIAALLNRTFFG